MSRVVHLLTGTGAACRQLPTCSEYTALVVSEEGWLRGLAKAIRRIASCHPFGASFLKD